MLLSSVLGRMLVGQFGWPMLVGFVIGLSSRSMCSSASVAMFLCMGGMGGKVSEGWEWLGVLRLGGVVVVLWGGVVCC